MSKRFLCLFACLTLLVLAPSVVAQADKEVRVEKNVVYGKGGDQDLQLDLAMPSQGEGPFPVLVMIHGGGWVSGNRQQLSKSIEVLAGRGYVAATISYRLAPKAKFPAQIEDCKAAIRFLRANAAKYRINPERIGVAGFSAGGHLACLLGVTGKTDGLEGKGGNPQHSSAVQAVVSFFGPTDLTRKDWGKQVETNFLIPFLGGTFDEKPELYKKASPITYVRKGTPPFLFFHGSNDNLVRLQQSKWLEEKLQGAGNSAKLVTVEGEGHGWGGEKMVKTIEETMKFFDEHLKK